MVWENVSFLPKHTPRLTFTKMLKMTWNMKETYKDVRRIRKDDGEILFSSLDSFYDLKVLCVPKGPILHRFYFLLAFTRQQSIK